MANLSHGLVQIVQTNGIGLVTRGFLWQGNSIWFDPQSMDGITTGWTAAIGYSGSATLIATTWNAAAGYSGAAAASLISTAWVASQSFGDEFPA